MAKNFHLAFEQTMGHEGGFVNDPDDPGGATNWGITQKSWDAYRKKSGANPLLPEAVQQIAREDAKAFYRSEYWEPLWLDALSVDAVAAELFDTAVNVGIMRATVFAQRACNLLDASDRPPLAVDGRMGPNTAGRLDAIARAYPKALLGALNFFQAQHYIELAERQPRLRKFIRGWMARTA